MLDTEAMGKQIGELMAKNGLSVRQLAEQIGVSTQAVYAWLHGRSAPSLDILIILAAIFHTPIEGIVICK